MKTRKEIGDQGGWKSLYVVEFYICNKWTRYGSEFVSVSKSGAVKLRNRAHTEYNKNVYGLPKYCFRVALYTRAE